MNEQELFRLIDLYASARSLFYFFLENNLEAAKDARDRAAKAKEAIMEYINVNQ